MSEAGIVVRDTCICSEKRSAASTVVDWLKEAPAARCLLALDAPLGWPTDLAVIANHSAGAPLDASRDQMFRRDTDRFIKRRLGQQPLDVGADRIARTAHSALALLQEIRERTGEGVPLAWNPQFTSRIAAIEVYPAATLRARRMRYAGYKKPAQAPERQLMVDVLSSAFTIHDSTLAVAQADVLDAVVCVLAASDFLSGKCMPPETETSARREGWIWAIAPSDV